MAFRKVMREDAIEIINLEAGIRDIVQGVTFIVIARRGKRYDRYGG